jgi:hypothetical protein
VLLLAAGCMANSMMGFCIIYGMMGLRQG